MRARPRLSHVVELYFGQRRLNLIDAVRGHIVTRNALFVDRPNDVLSGKIEHGVCRLLRKQPHSELLVFKSYLCHPAHVLAPSSIERRPEPHLVRFDSTDKSLSRLIVDLTGVYYPLQKLRVLAVQLKLLLIFPERF